MWLHLKNNIQNFFAEHLCK